MDVLRKRINDEINKYEISHASRGYVYLMEGVVILANEEVSRSRMMDVYRVLSQKYHIQAKHVEKAIHDCLKKAECKKTNKELILTILDAIIY